MRRCTSPAVHVRSDTKTTHFPSGEKLPIVSLPSLAIHRRGAPPSSGTSQRSACVLAEYTCTRSCVPSGETSVGHLSSELFQTISAGLLPSSPCAKTSYIPTRSLLK
jgi:hypothetical protein